MPAAALCGQAACMQALSPVGRAEMAGTNTGRQMTVMGTIAALRAMQAADIWPLLRRLNDYFVAECGALLNRHGVPAAVQGFGGRIGVHIGNEAAPTDFREVVARWNGAYHRKLYRSLHATGKLFGFLLPLGPCPEPVTLSAIHTKADIDETLDIFEHVLARTPYERVRCRRPRAMIYRAPVLGLTDLATCVRTWQSAGQSVALCHGRFDPLHIGHILHFEEARMLADAVVVTVTSDRHARVKPGRPFLAENFRAISVASQRCVGAVALNHTPGAVPILQLVRPDIYVKGCDYAGSSDLGFLEEAALAKDLGIRVCTTTSDKYSATALLQAMLAEIPAAEVQA
jgi:cytidyltransferase-like protein